ncbi:MAG: hypothetical protein OEZ41_10720 [Nitrospirota bacterium]|nr:hypothetical protein [Nitrospirota bacterium]MDH5700420.1 hypothetical protein [Nitrospirota bacterium]
MRASIPGAGRQASIGEGERDKGCETVKQCATLFPASAARLGQDVSLKRIMLEVTEESVRKGKIKQVLPCLRPGKVCVPLNKELFYGYSMSNNLNSAIWKPK